MASSCKRRIYSTEKRGFRQDLDLWRSKLINCVGVEKILELLPGTRILEDLNQFKDYKPASVSNWSFDENCLFCCLRREKVKEHVIALNNKIVESGGKPLLGKDQCNINRLEWKVEEFLNAVLHKKEYTPRIPDPHIPVVACDTMQQMIKTVVHYTSNNDPQDSPQHNGMDQSLLKTDSSTSPIAVATPTAAASTQNPVLSKLLMEDQDAPLDLSVKKVRQETIEQDVVLDLSIKKNRNPDSMLLNSPDVNLTTPVVRRQGSDSSFAKARDLQSSSTLEQFMAKLCLHHQRQIVDAFGFLQTEVKAVTSSTEEVSTPAIPEKPIGSDCAGERSPIQGIEETLPLAKEKDGGQESPVSKNNEDSTAEQPLKTDGPLIASIKNGSSIDLGPTHVGDNDEVGDDDVECRSKNIQLKCPTLLIVKNNHGNLEAKKLSEMGLNIQQPNTGTLEQGPFASDTQPHTHSIDHDVALSSCSTSHGHTDPKCLPARSSDAPVKSHAVPRTANAISPSSSRTAKKSSRGSHSQVRHGPLGNTVNDPDNKYDIVYVEKPITECKLQSQNHMLPRKNARKSTRGHLCFGDCWEIKTVRTLAHKSAKNGSGNYPVPMPEITTSVTPKQALAKPDGLPAMTVPFTGDCMETLINKNLSDQSVVTEMPGDVVEIISEDLIVEPSQTGQTQQKDQIPSLLADEECEPFVQQDSNVGILDNSDSSERSLSSTMANDTAEKIVMKETIDVPEGGILGGLEAEVQGQNVAKEAFLNTVSSSIENNVSEAEDLGLGGGLKNQNAANCDFLTKAPEQTKCLRKQIMTCTDNSTMLQMACETEAIKAVDSLNPDTVESRMSDLVAKEINIEERLEECREGVSEKIVTKKGVAKHTLPSDRCLRSGVANCVSEQSISDLSDQPKLADLQSDIHENFFPGSKQSMMSSKRTRTEDSVPCLGGQYDLDVPDLNPEKAQQSPTVTQTESLSSNVCTRLKHKLMMVKEMESDREQTVQELPNPSDDPNGHSCVLYDAPKNEANTPLESGEPHGKDSPGKSLGVSERMPLRNRSSQIEHSASSDLRSPTKNIPHTPERMPLRSRNSINVDQPVDGDFCSSFTAGSVEKLGRMPLRNRNSGIAEQTVGKDPCISPSTSHLDSVARMPLRNRSCSAGSRHVIESSSDAIGTSGNLMEQPNGEVSGVTSRKLVSTGHMPLRSGSGLMAEQSSSCNSFGSGAGTVSESPGRMSLRRSNTFSAERQDCLPTPPKNKKLSPRLQKMCRTSVLSLAHKGGHNSANIKTDKLFNDQMNSVPDSFASFNLPVNSSLIPSPCKFLEALNGEANQHLISDLNSKFDKMQKGWVQMEKEGQNAPKPKNKADRLKEIWKSKRRIRKPRSLEQHRFSPVQMLFMKSFDLPNICRWFLQSTETKSLVIVKKVNTRLPSETQLGFQTLPSVPESSDGVFPSLQAERLKKHLKKFAIASPVKSNPKNKRLIAKALAQGISNCKEKREPRSATRISSKPQSSSGLMPRPSLESHSKVAASAKNPASARILRKYSNMREKKQVQQNSLKTLKRSLIEADNSHSMTKTVSKEKLSTRRRQKSVIVKKVKRMAKKAKISAPRGKLPKGVGRGLRDVNEKDRISPKRVLPRVLKSNRVTSPKPTSKKEMLVKTERSPQTKIDSKKSPLHKASESLMSQSQIMDVKPLLSEDQVLTRSQRKMEATLAQTGSPKISTKRGMETLVTSAKRTRTLK